MKTMKFSFLILLFSFSLLTSCGDDDENNNSSGIPDEISSFWGDAYRQHQLKGKVKMVKTFDGTSTYDLLEYDSRGNLVKDYLMYHNNPDNYNGITLSYDEKNRLTKVVYGSKSSPETEVAEFGYDGSHTAYIPTNIYSMEDLRLQKGVTSVKYSIRQEEPMEVSCKSVVGNRITFEGTVGVLASVLGNISKVEVECNGSYPSFIKFQNMGTTHSEANVTFGADGMPTKVTYVLEDDEQVVTEYTSKGGFLLLTKQYDASDPADCDVYIYNDKGALTHLMESDGTEYRYTYKYDNNGNWTEKIEETKYPGQEWQSSGTEKREYTYWN